MHKLRKRANWIVWSWRENSLHTLQQKLSLCKLKCVKVQEQPPSALTTPSEIQNPLILSPATDPLLYFQISPVSWKKALPILAEGAGEGWGWSLPDGNAVACPCNLRLRIWLHYTDKLGNIFYQGIHCFQRSADQGSCVKKRKWEHLLMPTGESYTAHQTCLMEGARSLQDHSVAFSLEISP